MKIQFYEIKTQKWKKGKISVRAIIHATKTCSEFLLRPSIEHGGSYE